MAKLLVLQGRVIQADRKKYEDPDYSDEEIDGLMRYFHIDVYDRLLAILRLTDARKHA